MLETQKLGLVRNIATLHAQFQNPLISEREGEVILAVIKELQSEIDTYKRLK